MKRLVPIMAGLLALAACGGGRDEPEATIENAIVTLPAVPGRPGAAYFTLRSNRPARLVAISGPQIGRIEFHQTMNLAGMSRMAPLTNPGVSPDTPLMFAPGGRHAMLYDIAPSIRAGQRVTLTFTFDPLPPLTVEAQVRAAGDSHAGH